MVSLTSLIAYFPGSGNKNAFSTFVCAGLNIATCQVHFCASFSDNRTKNNFVQTENLWKISSTEPLTKGLSHPSHRRNDHRKKNITSSVMDRISHQEKRQSGKIQMVLRIDTGVKLAKAL